MGRCKEQNIQKINKMLVFFVIATTVIKRGKVNKYFILVDQLNSNDPKKHKKF